MQVTRHSKIANAAALQARAAANRCNIVDQANWAGMGRREGGLT